MSNYYVPEKTQALLDAVPEVGTRHTVMQAISFALIGNAWPNEMVYSLLRAKFNTPDISDKEIRDLVDGAVTKNPTPSGFGELRTAATRTAAHVVPMAKRNPAPAQSKATDTLTNDERTQRGIWWLADNFTASGALPSLSPVDIPTDSVESLELFLKSIYTENDRLNVVTRHFCEADGKAKPQGAGKTLLRDEWVAWIREKGIPQSAAGCWFRFNPCAEKGSGKDDAVTDADIVSHRFVLLESDLLDMDTQASVLMRLDIPIVAITSSGDKSLHALIVLAAKNEAEHKAIGTALLDALFRIGFDRGNKNPSRLSRLPGAMRSIKTLGDGWQRLLYLNPSAKPMTNEGVEALTLRLTRPRHASKPMRKLISTAVMRYSGLSKNGGVAGVKTGFETFDSVNGGLRAGLYYIIAAQTNIGKSSWTLNVISNALARGEGVALFSLEMSQDDVVDMLVSNRASIHRDVWNTGLLTENDQTKMMVHLPQLAESRLWIFDDPDMSIVDIRQKAEDLANQESVKLIVVDYMQFVAPLPGSRESREQQVSIISRGLKAMAKTTGVPVIGISSLNDDGKLRESRGSGYDADAVMELSELGDDALIGRVTKGRFIAKKPYKFNFHKATCKITDGGIYTEAAPEPTPRGKKAARNYHND